MPIIKLFLLINDALLYLTKYELNVLSLDKNNLSYDKNIQLFKSYLRQGTVKYLYVYENSIVENILKENNIAKITFKNLKNITDEERENEKNYISIMYENLDSLKKELYKNS